VSRQQAAILGRLGRLPKLHTYRFGFSLNSIFYRQLLLTACAEAAAASKKDVAKWVKRKSSTYIRLWKGWFSMVARPDRAALRANCSFAVV
jgi:hypothetical protein